MRIEDEDFEGQLRESRLASVANLEQAASILPPDPQAKSAIDGYRQSIIEGNWKCSSAQMTAALDRLEVLADNAAAPQEVWRLLMQAAIEYAEYERAHRYKTRAEAAKPAQ